MVYDMLKEASTHNTDSMENKINENVYENVTGAMTGELNTEENGAVEYTFISRTETDTQETEDNERRCFLESSFSQFFTEDQYDEEENTRKNNNDNVSEKTSTNDLDKQVSYFILPFFVFNIIDKNAIEAKY